MGNKRWQIYLQTELFRYHLFTYCGVEYFGPFTIKEQMKELKCYCALFTVLSSHAVHIEVANSLDAGSFIMALW